MPPCIVQRVEKKFYYKFLHAVRLWESEINFVFCERVLYEGTAPEQKTKSAKNCKDSMSLQFFQSLRVQQVAPTVSPPGSVGASALLKSARRTKIPGKKKGKAKRHQRRDRPPDLPVARTICLLYVFGWFCICLFHSNDPCKICMNKKITTLFYHIYRSLYYTYFKRKNTAGKAAVFLASADRYSRA